VVFDVCHSGDAQAAGRELALLRKLGKPVYDGLVPSRYVDLQRSGDANFLAGRHYYVKAGFLNALAVPAIDTVVDYVESSPVRSGCVIALSHLGGAISRVKPQATAYWNREPQRNLMINVSWDDAAAGERNVQWLREGWQAFEPLCTGFYVNDAAIDETERRIRTTYGANYTRLAALKRKYDPMNLFRLNANIKPAS
jgi:hypothetical protein